MSRLVIQEDDYGCGLATAAMLAGKTYAEAKAAADEMKYDYSRGMSPGEVIGTLRKMGFKPTDAVGRFHSRLTCILLVPSLNNEGSGHYIFYSPQTSYLDPNQGRPGKKYYTRESIPFTSHMICLYDCPETKKSMINLLAYVSGQLQFLEHN